MGNSPFQEAVVEISEEEAGGHGDHWDIFVDDLTAFIKKLPTCLQEGRLAVTYADNQNARPFPLPESEPKSGLLVWPSFRQGMVMVIALDTPNKTNEFISMYPWTSEGIQQTVLLEEVRLWPNRLEAQIKGAIGSEAEFEMVFFDPLFAANRAYYKKGGIYQFILTGMPYTFEVVDSKPIVIDDSEKVKRMRNAMYPDDPWERDSLDPMVFHTKGMAVFIPRGDIGADCYEYQGPVKSIDRLQLDMFGQPAWRVRITIHRFDEGDLDLDLCLSQKSLGMGKLPKPGDDVRGMLWLQGYLWMPGKE